VYSSPLQAYETVDKKTMSGREIEAAVLTKAARKLKDCQDSWDANDRDEKLVWSIFQGELKKEDNPLNRKLRADLLRLSAFIDRRIFETIAEPSPEKLNIVININNNIAAGLRESQENSP
jgi:flagellar protein FlaF